MTNQQKKDGWKASKYDDNKIINRSNTYSVTHTTYGAQDSNGDQIFTKSEKKLNDWIRKRS